MAFSITNYYDNLFNQQIIDKKTLAQKQTQDVNNRFDSQITKADSDTDKTIISSENSYDAAYADNAVQQAINERQIKKSMSDAGLSDSGLNRTQLTAVQLQKANADNAVSMQKMNFINNAKSALQDFKFQAELDRNNEINAIEDRLSGEISAIEQEKRELETSKTEEIVSNLSSFTDPTQAAAYVQAVSSQYGLNASDLISYTSVLDESGYNSYLSNKEYFKIEEEKELVKENILTMTDPTQVATYIKKMAKKYNISESVLVSWSPVINMNGYNKWLNNKNYFTNKASYNELNSSLPGYDTTSAAGQTAAAKAIKAWANSHKKSATKSKIKKLLESAGLSYSEYTAFLKDGQYFVDIEDAEESKKAKATKSGSRSSYNFTEPVVDFDDETEDDGAEDDIDFSDFDAVDWNTYFTEWRNTYGVDSAEEEFNRLVSEGKIKKGDMATARIAAYGSFGH